MPQPDPDHARALCKRCSQLIDPISWDCGCLSTQRPFWRDAKVVAYAPVLATVLLEYANVGQLIRMWSERTAAGQELTSWIAVFFALLCYNHFYRICCPEQRWAMYMNRVGMVMNLAVVSTVLYFRHFA